MNNGHGLLNRRFAALSLLLALALAACSSAEATDRKSDEDRIRSEYVTLDQGWNRETRQQFWFAPQGSLMLPYAWFLALELPASTQLLASRVNMERYNFIPMPASALNPDALPIGFSRERHEGQAFVGLTCAACHTAQLRLGGARVIVEGAPASANVNAFGNEFNEALRTTMKDASKFDRFAARVLGDDKSKGAKSALRAALGKRLAPVNIADDAIRAATTRRGHPRKDVVYGYGRIDAFGNILNSLSIPLDGQNGAVPDAPVSFPFLWDAPAADSVQWNGGSLNAPVLGGLSRNIGEVLGVFGRIGLVPRASDPNTGYANSVDLESLGRIENWLKELTSPAWPAQFLPPIDPTLAATGESIYRQECSRCHAVIEARDPARSFKSVMTAVDVVGTDPTVLVNLLLRRARTGPITGRRAMLVTGDPLPEEMRAIDTLAHAVAGVMLRDPVATMRIGLADRARTDELRKRPPSSERPPTTDAEAIAALRRTLEQDKLFAMESVAYRARPLNGIWATAPYLHNGSVPSLHDLLSRSGERPAKFFVGGQEFDPVKVGLRSESAPGRVLIDCQLPGNSNAGHEYGTGLPGTQKTALLEFLKTL
jgi:cytochrome c5